MNIVEEIKAKIKELEDQLEEIQDRCSHPAQAILAKNGSNTGNYDPSADSWWTDHHCRLCDKKWRTEQ